MKELKVFLYSELENKALQNWIIKNDKIYKIGRNPEKSDILVIDGTISRIHAELELNKENKIFIKDLNSANGTYIDTHQIKADKKQEIKVGQKIYLGECKNYLVVEETEEKIEKIQEKKPREKRSTSSESSKSKLKEEEISKLKKSDKDHYKNRRDRDRSHKKSRRDKKGKSNSLNKKSSSRSRSRRKHTDRRKSKEKKSKSIEKQNFKGEKLTNEASKQDKNYLEKNKKIKFPIEEEKNIEINQPNKLDTIVKSKENENPNDMKNENIRYNFKYEPQLVKFYEEFINLKKFEEDPKSKLPKLIDKEKSKSFQTGSISNNLDNRYAIKGFRDERQYYKSDRKNERNKTYKFQNNRRSSKDFRDNKYISEKSQRKNTYRKNN